MAPDAPTNLTFTAGDGQAVLNWNPSPGAASYTVYWGVTPSVAKGFVSRNQAVAAPPYTLKPLSNGVTYYAVVTAVNALGESPGSNQASGAPLNLVPPALRWSLPTNGLATQSLDQPLELAFTQDMDPASLVPANVTLTSPSGPVSGSVNYSGRLAAFVPNAPLDPATSYTLTASTAVKNAAGIALAAPVVVQFTTRPVAPTGLTPIPGNASISVTFVPAPGSTASRIYRRAVQANAVPQMVCETQGEVCTAFNLTNGTDYELTATSIINGVESDPSPAEVATPNDVQYPAAPTRIRARPGNASVYLDWDPPNYNYSYDIFRASQSGGPYTLVAGDVFATRYNDTSAPNGQPSYYVIQSKNSGLSGAYSKEVDATASSSLLAAPALVGTAGNSWVELNWQPVTGATRYVVLKSSQPNYAMQPTAFPVSNKLLQTNIGNGSAIYYVVYAVDANGNPGSYSDEYVAQPVDTGAVYPAAPNVRVTSNISQRVLVEWTHVDGANTYEVARGTNANGPFTSFISTGSLSWIDTAATGGTTYFYKVTPKNNTVATGLASTPVSVTALANQPNVPPGNLQSLPGSNAATLTWDPVPGASSYYVYGSTTPGGPYNSYYGGTAPGETVANITGLQSGQAYYFVVKSYFEASGTYSANSAEVSVTPNTGKLDPVSGITTYPGNNEVHLTWSAVPGASAYRIYRRSSIAGWTKLGTGTNTTSGLGFRDNVGLTNGFDVNYAVQAVNANGGGPWSYPTTTKPTGVAGPANVQVAVGTTGSTGSGCLTLTWDPVDGAYGYIIYTSATPNGPYSYLSYNYSSPENSYSTCSLQNGANYRIVVQAYLPNSYVSSSGLSAEVSATPSASKLGTPNITTNQAGDGTALLSWTQSAGATGYRIYRRTGSHPYALVGTVNGSTNTVFHDTGLVNDESYYWSVQPVGSSGSRSGETSGTPTGVRIPTGFTAEVGSSCATFHWDPYPGATSYYLYSSSTPGGPYSTYLTYGSAADETSATYCGLQDAANYYVVLQVGTAQGSSEYSQELLVKATSTKLAQPYFSNTVAGDREAYLGWQAVPGATGYRVYRRLNNLGLWTLVADTTALGLRDRGVLNLDQNSSYYYAVQAYNAAGAGPWSSYYSVRPTAGVPFPDDVQVISGQSCATVLWTPIPNGNTYTTSISPTPGGGYVYSTYTYDALANVCPSGSGVLPVNAVVQASVNGVGTSGYSEEASGVVDPSLPAAIYAYASASSPTSVSISFNSTSTPRRRVWRREGDTGRFVIIGETDSTTFEDTGLVTGTHYGYAAQQTGAGEGALNGGISTVTPQ